MKPCSSNNNYLASPEFLSFCLHAISCIGIPLHGLGFYCILYKTPCTMSSVKGLLLNLHSCCFLLDVITTLFAVPYAIFPAMAGYGLGFINSPGLFLYLIVTVITATSTAVFLIYENRYFVLFGDNSWWKHVRKPAIVASYIMVPIYFLPAQFLIPEQQEARKVVWKALECQPELPVHRELFVLSTDFIAPAYSIIIAEGVPAVQISTFFGINLYLLLFAEPSSRISERTMKLQKKLAFALFVQSYAILMLFTVPINVVVYIIKFEYQSQTVNNFVFIALSAHGSLSTLIMIFVHKPYRDFVLSPFRKMLRKVPTILVTSNAASRTFVE